jgi:hypothetical protein
VLNSIGSIVDGSSFSGLLTRVEIGHRLGQTVNTLLIRECLELILMLGDAMDRKKAERPVPVTPSGDDAYGPPGLPSPKARALCRTRIKLSQIVSAGH